MFAHVNLEQADTEPPPPGQGLRRWRTGRRSCDSPRSSASGPCRDLSGGIKEKAGARPPVPGGLAAQKGPQRRGSQLLAPMVQLLSLLLGLQGMHPAQAQGGLGGTGLSVGRGAGGCPSLAMASPLNTWEGPGRKKQGVFSPSVAAFGVSGLSFSDQAELASVLPLARQGTVSPFCYCSHLFWIYGINS